MFDLFKIKGEAPDSDYYENMDPLMKLWLYESWVQDLEDKHEFAKGYSILQGSFTNPQMARDMVRKQNPEHMSSDKDFEESMRMVLEDREKSKSINGKKRRRRRRRRKH